MKTSKRILSMVLTVIMLLSVVPMTDMGLKAEAVEEIYEGCIDGVYYSGYPDGTAIADYLCGGYCDKDDLSKKVHEVKKDITIHNSVTLKEDAYKTFKVVTVGSYAFQNKAIDTVTIEEGIKEIDERAFFGSSVASVTIPKTVEKIDQKAFSGCANLKDLTIEDGSAPLTIWFEAFKDCSGLENLYLNRVTGIDRYAFENLNLKNVYFDDNVSLITSDAFSKCTIDNVVFGDYVDTFGDAFSYCTIKKLTLPISVGSVSTAAFWNTEVDEMVIKATAEKEATSPFLPQSQSAMGFSLNKISVEKDNPYYSVVDDVLFNEEMTELIFYSPIKTDKTYKIPEGVAKICVKAFNDCDNLEKIQMPDSVIRICRYAFYKCNNLKQVDLSKKLEYIEGSAFSSCPIDELSVLPKSLIEVSAGAFSGHALTDVYYDGTEEEWKSISYYQEYDLGESGIYVVTSFSPNVTMHFNEETPEEPEHTHSFTSGVILAATCEDDGIMSFLCKCGQSYTEIIPATGHKDENGDYKCDNNCGYEFEKPAPEDPSKDCSCNCHKKGISNFFFKIILFFQKIFRTNKTCACGIAHY